MLANRASLKLLSLLALFFFLGGITGALGFKHFGYVATLPLAIALIVLAIAPIFDDMKQFADSRQTS